MTPATMIPTAVPVPPPPSAVDRLAAIASLVEPGEHVLITGVTYADFMSLAEWRDAACRWSIRLAFDTGDLEIMVVTNPHERFHRIVALLVEEWLMETQTPYLPSGHLTHRREDLQKGFEPDQCYYIQNWKPVAGFCEIDFTKDPPPDLAIEAEKSRKVLNRLPIYAAFEVPEVWRYNGERLIVLLLQPDGTYRESTVSRAFPSLPLAELPHFLALAKDVSMNFVSISRLFREWARSLLAAPKAGETGE